MKRLLKIFLGISLVIIFRSIYRVSKEDLEVVMVEEILFLICLVSEVISLASVEVKVKMMTGSVTFLGVVVMVIEVVVMMVDGAVEAGEVGQEVEDHHQEAVVEDLVHQIHSILSHLKTKITTTMATEEITAVVTTPE